MGDQSLRLNVLGTGCVSTTINPDKNWCTTSLGAGLASSLPLPDILWDKDIEEETVLAFFWTRLSEICNSEVALKQCALLDPSWRRLDTDLVVFSPVDSPIHGCRFNRLLESEVSNWWLSVADVCEVVVCVV